jgi:hypothetical protein
LRLQEVAEYLKNNVIKLFPNKIAIIALYGSTVRGKDDEFSDLDMYAIVDKENECNLPLEFVFQNHTIDFWKMDWQQAEIMASGKRDSHHWAVTASLFRDSKILYTRSNSDKAHFEMLVKKTERCEEDNVRLVMKDFYSGYSHIEKIKRARLNNDLLSARWAAWKLINKSVKDLSLLNNTYLTKNWGANLQEVFNLPLLPKNYAKLVTTLGISNNFDEMIGSGLDILTEIYNLIIEKQQSITIDYHKTSFCNNYISMRAYINKILSGCSKKDILSVSYAATELQIWIAEEIARIEGNLIVDVDNFHQFEEIKLFYNQLNFPDLMEGISAKDFQKIKKVAEKLDLLLQEYYNDKKCKIPILNNLEELKTYIFP